MNDGKWWKNKSIKMQTFQYFFMYLEKLENKSFNKNYATKLANLLGIFVKLSGYIRGANVVADHNKLLTQWKYI